MKAINKELKKDVSTILKANYFTINKNFPNKESGIITKKMLNNFNICRAVYTKNILFKFYNKKFCFKYIPFKKLHFQDIGYIEKACLIYQQNDYLEKRYNKKDIINKTILLTTLATIIYSGLNLLSIGISSAIFPLLYYSFAKYKKFTSTIVKRIYLCKNGHQLIFQTLQGEFHILNIRDITNISFFNIKKFISVDHNENNINSKSQLINDAYETCYLFCTHDKRFVIETKSQVTSYLNGEIFETFNNRSIISTSASYSNYSRLYFPK